jgi:hypothetical protein
MEEAPDGNQDYINCKAEDDDELYSYMWLV